MTSPSTRFLLLLAALLLVGQLAGLLHALEHPGGHGSRIDVHPAPLATWQHRHRTDPAPVHPHVHPHVHAHDAAPSDPMRRTAASGHGDGPPCGGCLLAAASVALPGPAMPPRAPLAGDGDVSVLIDVARPAWRSSAHRARAPPTALS